MAEIRNGMNASQLPPDLVWRKSTHSNPNGNCVEIAELPDGRLAFRNSRDAAGPVLVYTRDDFVAFVHSIENGEFDDFIDD